MESDEYSTVTIHSVGILDKCQLPTVNKCNASCNNLYYNGGTVINTLVHNNVGYNFKKVREWDHAGFKKRQSIMHK